MSELLCFEVTGGSFAVPLEAVAEVAQALPLYAIPLLPQEEGGIVNLRGEPLPVVDAGALLTGTPGLERRHLLILEGEPGRVGLAVSRVSGIRRDLLDARASAAPAGFAPLAFATWFPSDLGPIGVLDPHALLRAAARRVRPVDPERGASSSRREIPCHDAF